MMASSWSLVPLWELLTPISRAENVEPQKIYHILGAHWYATGLYTKDTKPGSQIQANMVYRVEEGDFVYNRLFAWKGSFAVATEENHGCYVSNEFPCFIVNSTRLEPLYLWHYFSRQSAWDEALGLSSGSTPTSRNRLKEGKLLAMEIPLPPLDEQRRIVAHIEALAAKIEEARGLRRGALEEAETILDTAIIDILSEFQDLGKSSYLGDFTLDVRYGTSRKTNDDPSGTPIFRMGNIQGGKLLYDNFKYLDLDVSERKNLLLTSGDLLVNRTNSAELVGKCAVFEDVGEFSFASYLIRLRLDTTKAIPKLVAYYINSPMGRNYMFLERKQMTGQANVNSSKLRALPIVLPSVSSQSKMLDFLDGLETKVNELRILQKFVSRELDALLPSILDKAFKGEL